MPVAIKSTGGGSVTLTAPSTASDLTLTLPSASGTVVSADGSGNVSVSGALSVTGNETVSGNLTITGSLVPSSSFLRNRIINGAMQIDQRNAGAAVNASGGNKTYPVDRFYSQVYNTTGNTTGQQSSIAPSGFVNSMKISVQTADTSVGATDQVWYGQDIEGFNVSDFGFGASGAATITLSFWVYSNVTGTYCVTFKNSAENRGYTAEYIISASNTWEKKTITVAGDTTGTWLTTNGAGLKVWFVLMAGSSQQTTANTWNATSGSIATSNQVNFMSSTSNVWYLAGVQLEVGSVATPFERESFSHTLAKCQRYYQKSFNLTTSPTTATADGSEWFTLGSYGGRIAITTRFAVSMRTNPTITTYDWNGASGTVRTSAGNGQTGFVIRGPWQNNFGVDYTGSAIAELLYQWTASAEL